MYKETIFRAIQAKSNFYAIWLPDSLKFSGWCPDVCKGKWLRLTVGKWPTPRLDEAK